MVFELEILGSKDQPDFIVEKPRQESLNDLSNVLCPSWFLPPNHPLLVAFAMSMTTSHLPAGTTHGLPNTGFIATERHGALSRGDMGD